MIGVVIWRDEKEDKAVIWCEDQGDLAFFKGRGHIPPSAALDVGDVVRFHVDVCDNIRYAQDVCLLADNWRTGLETVLGAIPNEPDGVERMSGAEILPFRSNKVREQDDAVRSIPRRHG